MCAPNGDSLGELAEDIMEELGATPDEDERDTQGDDQEDENAGSSDQ